MALWRGGDAGIAVHGGFVGCAAVATGVVWCRASVLSILVSSATGLMSTLIFLNPVVKSDADPSIILGARRIINGLAVAGAGGRRKVQRRSSATRHGAVHDITKSGRVLLSPYI